MAAAFEPLGGRVLYAVKANANLAVLATLAGLGAGFDVVSGGELVQVLRAGGDPEADRLRQRRQDRGGAGLAVGHGVTVHVESADELDLQAVAAGQGGRRFAVRGNPDVEVDTHVNIQTGHDEAKFGVPVAVAHELLARAARGGLRGCGRSGSTSTSAPSCPTPTGWPPAPGSAWRCWRPAGRPAWSWTGWTSAAACRSTTPAGRPSAPSCSRPPWRRWWPAGTSGWGSSRAGPWWPGPAPW